MKFGLGGGVPDIRFLKFLLCHKLESAGLSDTVLESFPGSDSANAVIKHMPVPVASTPFGNAKLMKVFRPTS